MRISTLSDLMGEAIRIQDRLRPHLDRYRRHLSEDEDFRQTGAVSLGVNHGITCYQLVLS